MLGFETVSTPLGIFSAVKIRSYMTITWTYAEDSTGENRTAYFGEQKETTKMLSGKLSISKKLS